jgi:3-hydroxy-3-methylglutaryl CoA synthase
MKTLILSELKTTESRLLDVVTEFRQNKKNYRKLGEGLSREVYLHPNKKIVLKYQKEKVNESGLNSNLLEFQNYVKMSKLGRQFLAASYFYREFGNGSSVLVSEYIQGDTLRQSFKDKKIPESIISWYGFCQAVEDTLRRFGLCCTDIHEYNIIIPKNGVGFKVVDYSD